MEFEWDDNKRLINLRLHGIDFADVYALLFIYGLSARYNTGRLGGEEFSPKVAFLDQVYRGADNIDCIAAVFISILLFWQISILLRMLIKTLQRKTELP